MNILPFKTQQYLGLLQNTFPALSRTNLRRLSRIILAMLAMTGRVTMLGLSRWAGKGGSYRTVQRYFGEKIAWAQLYWQFFVGHLYQPQREYILAGDESVVTKSGKQTYGLDRFFSGLLNQVVPSIAIFALSLIDVKERRSYPIRVEQVVRSEAEKAAAKARKQARKAKKKSKLKGKPGRPKGSKNWDKTLVELTPELLRIQQMVKQQLAIFQGVLAITYLALDGHFGNNNALQMVRQCGLHLISKLRCDAALHFVYQGPYAGKGPHKKYGDKINYDNLSDQYLVETHVDRQIETRIYHAQMPHHDFAQLLNVVIIHKTNTQTGACANVNLFSSDLGLAYDQLIDYYRLRFQLEFNFRDAKQHWGLEDWMNITEVPLTNALNLSLFMVNVSQVLLAEFRKTNPKSSVLDLKAYCRAARYFEETIKMLPKKPEPLLIEQVFGKFVSLGCIHPVNVQIFPP
jgi:putative transposase